MSCRLIDIAGYHRVFLNCRRCHHEWSGRLPQNTLVGLTHRLRCSRCGEKDVAVSMSWIPTEPPPFAEWPPNAKKPRMP
jgi:hypothetical protein